MGVHPGRAVQGLGGGLVIVALYVVVGRAYPERLRPAIMAAFAACWVVPSVVGPLAAGTVTEHLGWRWVFLGIPVLVVRRSRWPCRDTPAGERTREGRPALRPAADPARPRDLPRRGAPPVRGPGLRPVSLVPAAAGRALLVPAVRGLLPRGTWRAARGLPSVVLLRGVAAGPSSPPSPSCP